MKWLSLMNGGSLYAEVRQRSLRVLYGEQSLVVPLERDPAGRLTRECKEKVSAGLRTLLKKKNWQPRARAFCAIEARGVSLRRLSLPASANGDLHRVLRLQIESEFPLPPEALAWGYARVEPMTAANGRQDFMVVALKKDWLEEYAQMFAGAGVNPMFTLAALARSRACPQTARSYAVLDIGRCQSELILFEDGCGESLRVLPWGGDDITRAIEQSLGISADEAEKLKLQSDEGPVPNGEVGKKIHAAIGKALESLASMLNANWSGQKLYLTGRGSRYREMPRRLTELLPNAVDCERIETTSDDAPTAAIVGLKKAAESESAPPLVLRLKESKGGEALTNSGPSPSRWLAVARAEAREIAAQPALRKRARLALLLGICLVCFPYAEAFLLKPFLARKLATIKAEKGRLATIDRELSFLQYLKKSQPPYLDALTVVANASPPGTRFDTVSMNRRGELSLKGNMRDGQQVVDFRSKLIKSGFFSNVTVEEQTPSPDRQKMAVRIAAQWKPAGARPLVKAEPLPAGFSPGGPGMPFPDMGSGGPVAFFPGSGMPGMSPSMSMPRGGPEGAMLRGPDGAPLARKGEKSKSPSGVLRIGPGGEVLTNSTDSAKPSAEEDAKDTKKSKDAGEPKDSKESPE